MRFSVSLTSQPKSSGMQMGLQGVPVVGHLGFHEAWKNLGVRLILAIGLVSLLNAPGFGLQSAPEAQSKKAETKVEGKVCSAAGAAVADALVSLVNGAEERVAETQTDGDGKFVILVAQPGEYWLLEARKDGFRTVRTELAGPGEGQDRHCKVVMETSELAKVGAETGEMSKTMEYSDEANFTIAGVRDWSGGGVHGSDVKVRTSETLAKEAAGLKSNAANSLGKAANDASAHRLLGDVKEKNRDAVGAVSEYEKAVKIEPSEENYFAWGAELLLHRAGVAAVEVFRKGAVAYPESSRMLAGLGAAYFADGQYREAAERMCEASDLNPQDPVPHLFLGKMEKATEDLPACSAARLKRFASEQPESALANEYFGLVLWKKGRREQSEAKIREAEGYFKKAAAIDPSLGEVYVQLGMLYQTRGENHEALRAFQSAVKASPKSSDAHYQLSLVYRRAGNAAKSKRELNACQELRRSEDAELEKERRDLQQFVTVLKDGQATAPK
jgi:tetratricopeptide (TPR) repeat protein